MICFVKKVEINENSLLNSQLPGQHLDLASTLFLKWLQFQSIKLSCDMNIYLNGFFMVHGCNNMESSSPCATAKQLIIDFTWAELISGL